jgi:hypothetical protein
MWTSMQGFRLFAAVLVLALAVTGCRSMTGRSLGQQVDDKSTTAQVKTKLTSSTFGNLFSTDVGTHYGVVRLGGSVATAEQKAEAERLARGVAGVRRVQNDIVVVPRDQTAAVTPGTAPPAASPAAPSLALTGQVTAIDRATGDVTLHTDAGDMVLRLPPPALREIEQGQRLSINAGQR